MDEKKIKIPDLQYGLKGFQCLKFYFELPRKKFNIDVVEFNYNINPMVSFVVKEGIIVINVAVKAELKETSELLIDTTYSFLFSVLELNKHVDQIKPNNRWKFKHEKHNDLVITLIGIAVSSMRGVLHERTKGTILEKFPLPLINPSTFIKNFPK